MRVLEGANVSVSGSSSTTADKKLKKLYKSPTPRSIVHGYTFCNIVVHGLLVHYEYCTIQSLH